eukprot:6000085-Amphidinium_carterae.1
MMLTKTAYKCCVVLCCGLGGFQGLGEHKLYLVFWIGFKGWGNTCCILLLGGLQGLGEHSLYVLFGWDPRQEPGPWQLCIQSLIQMIADIKAGHRKRCETAKQERISNKKKHDLAVIKSLPSMS